MDPIERERLLDEPRHDQAPSREDFVAGDFTPAAASGSDVSIASSGRPGGMEPLRPPRTLTLLNGLALVVGLQIGSGIFSAPSVVLSRVSSPVVAIFVWLLAGALVWTGASSFIELGTRVPHNGGIQEYLRHCYGDLYGFLFAWIWLLVSRPCAMAMVSLVFSEYLFRAILPEQDVSTWILKAVAFLAIILITYLNCMGTKVGTGSATFFLVLKVFGLGSIAVLGLFSATTGPKTHDGSSQPNGTKVASFPGHLEAEMGYSQLWNNMGNFTDAVLAALFAYGGWESVGFVIGEMKEPQYTLPRVLNLSMAMVITLFALANIALYSTLSLEVLQKTNAVAIVFGMEILGRPGALFYAWIVCLSCLGALNAIVFSTGRLTQAAGARNYLPAVLGAAAGSTAISQRHSHNRNTLGDFLGRICSFPNPAKDENIPANAMVLNAIVAAVYVLIGSFRGLLNFKGMVEYSVYLTAVSGVLLLRLRHPLADATPRSRIYLTKIFNPIAFSCVASLIVIRSAIAHIFQALTIVLIFGIGSLIYLSSWRRRLVGVAVVVDGDQG